MGAPLARCPRCPRSGRAQGMLPPHTGWRGQPLPDAILEPHQAGLRAGAAPGLCGQRFPVRSRRRGPRRPEEALPAAGGRRRRPRVPECRRARPGAQRRQPAPHTPPCPALPCLPAAGMRSEAAAQLGGVERFASAGKGRGLRARRRFAVGELLLSCPAYVAVLTVSERGSHCDGCFAR